MCERPFCAATMCAMTQRRTVLKLAGAAAAGFLPLPHALAQIAKAPPKPENVLSPDAALQRLMQGNARYVDGVSKRHDFSHEREPLRTGQNPFAGILSCADSRIAPEYCFDTARGDIFVCRVAGNFASAEIVASLEYAVQVLKTPLVLVLGHDACGAVDATIKSIKDGTALPGHLPTLVAAISPAVKAVQGEAGRHARERNSAQRNAERRETQGGGADSRRACRGPETPRRWWHLQTGIRESGTFGLTNAAVQAPLASRSMPLGHLATKLLQHFVAIALLNNALGPRLRRSRSSSVSSFATMTTIFLYNNSVTTATRCVKFLYRVIFHCLSCETQSIACNQKVVIEKAISRGQT